MSVLVINFILVTFFLILYKSNEKNERIAKILLFLIFTQLLYIKTFADIDSLPDLISYRDHFEYVQRVDWNDIFVEKTEFGHFILCKLCSLISGDFRFFLFVYSFVFLYLYFMWIRKHSVSIPLSILLFLLLTFNGSLYVLRQHMAIAILLLSYPYIIRRDFISFFIVVCLASSFHLTAIVFLPVYLFYNIGKWRSMIMACLVGGEIAVWMAHNPYLLLAFLSDDSKYTSTFDSGDFSTTSTGALISAFFLMTFIFYIRKKCVLPGYYRLFFYMLIISTVILFVGIGLPLFPRLASYYSVSLILIIPLVATHIQNRYIRLLYVACVLCLETYLAFFTSSAQDYMAIKMVPCF